MKEKLWVASVFIGVLLFLPVVVYSIGVLGIVPMMAKWGGMALVIVVVGYLCYMVYCALFRHDGWNA